MSADVLRSAAALMRERAEAATYGDGAWCPDYLASAVRNMQRNCDWDCPKHEPWNGPDSDEECPQPTRYAGTHIASWHPAVALAVADWLDAQALLADDMPGFDIEGMGDASGLAVARAYLRTTP